MVDENGDLLPRKRRWPKVLAAAGLIALLVAAEELRPTGVDPDRLPTR